MLNCMAAQHAAERAAAKLHALEAQAAANHEVRGRERERERGRVCVCGRRPAAARGAVRKQPSCLT
jgi:hypothetical protein